MIPQDVVAAGPAAVEHYRTCKERGCSDAMAEMLALRSAPTLNTQTSWVAQNTKRAGMVRQFGPQLARQIAADTLRKTGVKIDIETTNYNPTAAEYRGDLRAYYDPQVGEKLMTEKVQERRERSYDQKRTQESKQGVAANPVHVLDEAVKLSRADRAVGKRRKRGEVIEHAVANVKRSRKFVK